MAENQKNIFAKINEVKSSLANSVTKSGHGFAGNNYITLKDIVPLIIEAETKNGIYSAVNTNREGENEIATLTIIDVDNSQSTLTFSMPLAEAGIAKASPMQNVGGSITYARRYLYMMAYNIADVDQVEELPKIDYRVNPKNGKLWELHTRQELEAVIASMQKKEAKPWKDEALKALDAMPKAASESINLEEL